ncbi:MAG TPA: PBP1A family penicillin-binding protein [Aestuariivirga sp.]|nr:PBP1A family penicillin-binding protein [Aestuariivirga sp.]HRA93971.1 PBP1A family penicillin-binding protein [Aestuariivirga sp.]
MGLFGGRKRHSASERREPQLFDRKKRRGAKDPERPPRRRRSFLGWLFSFAFKSAVLGCIALAAMFGYVWFSLSQKGLLQIPELQPGIMLLAEDGTVLSEQGSFFGDQVRVSELPDYVPNALIAIEDHRFRSHFGVDPLSLVRAAYENFTAGRVVQGGSTITQQLAKNLFLKPERTYSRKAQELVLALWLETKFSKDDILQLYLNRVYYGSGATGIEKAAQVFYHKSAVDLNLTEAATLAGVLKAPTNYNPITRPDASAERAGLVIDAMVDAGFISQGEADQAINAPATVVASDYVPATQYVVDWVNEQLPLLVKNYDQSIIVETTIDPQLQLLAERSLRTHLNEEGRKLRVSQGAMVVMDTFGAVKAMVGGKSYKRSQYNRATKAMRQPGSTFKPFVFLAAMEKGYTPESVAIDQPIRIGSWQPENYNNKYLGRVTLRTAMANSLNSVAAQLANNVGPRNVVAVAHRLGITSHLGTDASIALGTSEVTLLELTSAFTPFANGGYSVVPFSVRRIVTRDGQIIYERSGDGLGQAMSNRNLGSMNSMMRAVVNEGTAKKAQIPDFDIAGKTGTSQDYRDAWFVGYSSYLVGGVWLGNDDNSPTRTVTGGSMPAAIWKDVMQVAHANLSPAPLPGYIEEQPESADPYLVSQDEGMDYEEFETPRRKRGFFERLFGGSDEPRAEKRVRRQSKNDNNSIY